MDFIYDENGAPLGLDYNGTRYYYITNLEGDIVKIINQSGVEVVEYTYDGWGVPTVSGSLASTLGQDNPFRFKGYYYDVESGMYYLGNRYYDPIVGRFINADNVEILDGGTESLLGNNMFIYCFNNPILLTDEDGNWPSWATKVLIGTAVIATAAILTVATAGTGTALACFAVGALKGAATGAAIGAVQGGITGAVVHRVKNGSWTGAGTAALNGAADGYMMGAITGFITGGLTSNACFVAGTVILTVAGKKAIEEIQVGDKVWAWDEKSGDVAVKEVVETYINESKELIHVFVEGEEIITTPTHPFYSPTRGWTEAIQLRAGDILVLVNGEYVIVEKVQHEILESPVLVYNFQVEDYHTYYVSDTSVLVHNMCQPLKGKDAVEAAKKLGYTATKQYSKGQRIFYNSKTRTYITADIDGHKGGVWKMAKTIKDLASKSTRMGTYDAYLNRIGD